MLPPTPSFLPLRPPAHLLMLRGAGRGQANEPEEGGGGEGAGLDHHGCCWGLVVGLLLLVSLLSLSGVRVH